MIHLCIYYLVTQGYSSVHIGKRNDKYLILILHLLVFKIISWFLIISSQETDWMISVYCNYYFYWSSNCPISDLEDSSRWQLRTFALTIVVPEKFLAIWYDKILQAQLRSGVSHFLQYALVSLSEIRYFTICQDIPVLFQPPDYFGCLKLIF